MLFQQGCRQRVAREVEYSPKSKYKKDKGQRT